MKLNKKSCTCIDLGDLKDKKIVCLTLDLEQDYGDLLSEPSYEALEEISDVVDLLKRRKVPLTCFVQGSLLETHPRHVKQLYSLDVEFGLHSYSHRNPKESDTRLEIEKGTEAYRKFFNMNPIGYRTPLGMIEWNDYEILMSHGFKYDSSIIPSVRPSAFNNLSMPAKPFFIQSYNMVEFPLAVFSNVIRIPISLSYIKLLGKPYLNLLKFSPLPNLIIFGFHLHDLFELSSSKNIPVKEHSYIYRWIFRRIYQNNGGGLSLLDECITVFEKRGYTFLKLIDIFEVISKRNESRSNKYE